MNNIFTLTAVCLSFLLGNGAFAQPSSDVRDDIRTGLPIRTYQGLAQRYDVTAVPKLIEMINATSDMRYWEDAVGVLGTVGDERAVDALIELIERPPVESEYISEAWHDARANALFSLGLLVHRTASEKALEYLLASVDDTIWRRRDVRGPPSYGTNYLRYDWQLSKWAVFGLAVTGHPRAGDALRSLQQSPAPNQQRLQVGLDDTLDSWLEAYDLVAERGVVGMYDYYDQQRQENGVVMD